MTPRLASRLALLIAALAACDKTSPAKDPSSSGTAGASEAGADACTSDNCIVPLAAIGGVCGPTLKAATTDCPGVTVFTAPCAALTHVELHTVGPVQDCYYDTASGALVGGIVRSDAGFTKIAGTIPADACPATTQVCDHTVP